MTRLARRAVAGLFCAALAVTPAAPRAEAPAPTLDAPAYPRALHPGPMSRAAARARAADLTALGRELFFDPGLSASGAMACATCHDPARGFGPPGAGPVASGGPSLDRAGTRAVPALRYLQATPAFTAHYFESDEEGDESVDGGPTGGLTWDGRVDRARDQAKIPLLSPDEMANASPAAVAARLAAAPYAASFRRVFGESVFEREDDAFDGALDALDAFQQSPSAFYPYSSRYDAFLAGRAQLGEQELRGLKLFSDAAKGDCARCHPARPSKDGAPPQFTDYAHVALGVPRNRALPANADPAHFDLGLCGPLRADLADHPGDCGRFRTPSLRNVALRQSFFHNGAIHDLRAAVAFYATRDTDPGRWYPRAPGGGVETFDDLPERYRANLEKDTPFGGAPGGRAPLDDAEIDAIVAFLKTLTDADLAPRPESP
ncbi:cytochrome-c peroxidase [Methylocella sp.]|uniref:cytochrome-c peroxidase n=1 Tax=Methylocella sp. TaxID=1978226 RepID=UPI003784D1AF